MGEMQVDNFCKFDYSEKVTVYMSHEQRHEIEREARAAHLKVSDWCRRELAAQVYLHHQAPYKLRRDMLRVLIIGFMLLTVWSQLPGVFVLARRLLL